ncbi:MAG TPA: class I SAM-dependent methyltransferase [Aridibacter sp.]|nr:class I SAM-dependent methyltransferase [Aridibacter sp.]
MIIDIGTGDGRFVFRSAERDADSFWIGVDANPKPLQKISTKAARKLGKGRRANAMFVHASAEDLPEEFARTADEIRINFPWGSLLGAVLSADPEFLARMRQILKPEGTLTIITGIDPERDRSELERLGVEPPTRSSTGSSLVPSYAASGFRLVSFETGSAGDLRAETTWARKLKGSPVRRFMKLAFKPLR